MGHINNDKTKNNNFYLDFSSKVAAVRMQPVCCGTLATNSTLRGNSKLIERANLHC